MNDNLSTNYIIATIFQVFGTTNKTLKNDYTLKHYPQYIFS